MRNRRRTAEQRAKREEERKVRRQKRKRKNGANHVLVCHADHGNGTGAQENFN